MENKDFNKCYLLNEKPEQVFTAIQAVDKWWTGYYNESIEGKSNKLGAEFSFSAGPGVHFSHQTVVEYIPNKKLVWLVSNSNLSFLENPEEWNGSKIIFTVNDKEGKTELCFTHFGLSMEKECYNSCAPAWTQYLDNKLIPFIKS